MTLENLKTYILTKDVSKITLPIIFKCDENTEFILKDYIKEIAKLKGLEVKIIYDLNELTESLFNNNLLYIFKGELSNLSAIKDKNIITIVKKIKEKSELVIEVPAVEAWQVADYIKSRVPALSIEAVTYLSKYTNLFKLDLELQKLELFKDTSCNNIFNDLITINTYDDIESLTNYDLASAIIKKDLNAIKILFKTKQDFEPFSIINILLKNFKQMIDITFNPHITCEAMNINQKVFNAIKFNSRNYTAQELIDNYKFLLNIDYQVKTGNLSTNNLLDYIVSSLIKKGEIK